MKLNLDTYLYNDPYKRFKSLEDFYCEVNRLWKQYRTHSDTGSLCVVLATILDWLEADEQAYDEDMPF